MRILLWSPRGSGLHYGGPGMTAYRLYRIAQPGRFALTLAHGAPDQGQYDLFERQVLIRPLPERGANPLSIAYGQARFVQTSRRWVREHVGDFDVFHGLQGFDLTVQPALEARRHGLPAVVKIAAHRTDLADKGGWKRLLGRPRRRREAIAELSAVIAISTAIRDELLEYGLPEEKIALIPNGVDTDLFRPVADAAEKQRIREELGWPDPDRPVILFAGGLNQRKRPHLLVEALPLLKARGYDYTLVLLGPHDDAGYLAAIKRTAAAAGLGARLLTPGFVRDPAPYYRAADFFCLPSSSEGLPNALLEAMATALPCLVTPVSGAVDLVEDGVTGLHIEPTAAGIADAITERAKDRTAALGTAARILVERRCSTTVVLDMHEQLFRAIIRR